ncbi:MAG TPA: YciI family protein [Phycisphaerae bacterium]|nr:YciI family protein [Phycisphaerae bacterium]
MKNRFNALLTCLIIAATLTGCSQTKVDTEAQTAPPPDPHYIYYIHPVREGFITEPTPDEARKVGAHFEYLKKLTGEGTVLLAGPSTDPPYTGIVILKAKDRETAEAVMNKDPAVRGGVFRARLSPISLSLVGNFTPTPM